MLPDEANMQKQKKREEQLRKWREREMSESSSTIESFDKSQRLSMPKKETRVKFPKGCVFLAACSSGDIDEVRAQLKIGVNINTTNIDGLTALHQACIDANLAMVQFLVEHDADLNAQDNEGWTPLHAAVSVGNLEVVKFLVLMGARLDVCNSDSDLPIDLCDSSNVQMREYLEEEMRRRDIDAEYEKRREEALMYEDAKEANFFDKVHNKTGATALHVSAAKGYLRVIKLLLQYNANVNEVDKDGWTPLHAAAHWEQEEACKLLIENGASLDIKNYAGQTPIDVCDKDMSVKLKALQQQLVGANTIQKEKQLNDLNQYNNNNSSSRLDARVRRVSDELNKSSSITRLTNDAKSSLSEREKKQEKILLSPITTSVTKPQFDIFANSDSEADKANKLANLEPTEERMDTSSALSDSNHLKSNDDRFTFDKENINRSNSYTNSNNSLQPSQGNMTSTAATTTTGNNVPVTDQETKVLNKSNSLNKPKTGLQESLKTLSAQLKLKMDEDKDEINDKNISLKPSSSNGDLSTTTTSSSLSSNGNSSTSPSTNNLNNMTTTTNLSSPTNTNSSLANSNTTNGTRPYTDRRWGNSTGQGESSTYRRRVGGVVAANANQPSPLGSPLGGGSNNPADLQNPLSPNGENSRRYSTAPIASKDEQAELIRKQKAKLERHFRRSTQAVSYEDIKSAEATIKGSNPTTPTSASPLVNSGVGVVGNADQPAANSDLNGPIPPASTTSTTTFNFNTTVTSPTTPAAQTPQILATVPINSPPISQQGVSNLTSLFGELITKNSSSSNLYSNQQQQPSTQPQQTQQQLESTTPTTAPTTAPSTTAATTTTNPATGEKDTIIANDIETDKLLNAIEKSKGFSDSYSTQATRRLRNRAIPFFAQPNSNSSNDRFQSRPDNSNRDDENKPTDRLFVQQSPNSQIKRINSGSSLDSNNQLSIDVANNSGAMTQTSSTRPMYRFGQNESNNGQPNSGGGNLANINNSAAGSSNSLRSAAANPTNNSSSSSAAVKRSVSQVPSSDRRALTTNGTAGSSSTNAISGSEFSNNNNVDYQTAYELMKKENELLNQTVLRLQKELDDSNKFDGAGGLDKRERRALDRKISELEEEVKKVENLKQDNNRLKEENAALIRVISKLSK